MLNRHNLNIAKLAPREESRFTLNGIHCTPERTTVTDGHKLPPLRRPRHPVRASPVIPDAGDATDTWKPFILPTADALAIAKAIPVKSTIPVLAHAVVYSKSDENGAAFLGVTDLSRNQVFQPRKLSGNFPDWQHVVPNQADAKFTIAFNAKYIAELMQQFMGASADPAKAFVTWRFTDNISAVRMDAVVGDAQTMTAILMPVRVDTDTPQEKAGEELQSLGLPVGETEAGARIQSLEAEVASLKAELAKAKGKPAPAQPAAVVKPKATVTWVPMRNGSMRAVTA